MKKRLITGMALWASLQCGMAQSLEKMQWFNEPEQWEIKNRKPGTDHVRHPAE